MDNNNLNKRRLRIKDAFKQDAGRGIVRIDPEVMKNLNLQSGDAIEISNPSVKKKTAALLLTGKEEDKDSKVIRIDPSLRRNINASIDDYVEIQKIQARLAETLTFAGLDESYLIRDSQQLARKLENRVISKGDNLSFYAMGRRIDLVVIDYTPSAQAVKINLNTKIKLSEKKYKEFVEEKPAEVKYEAISELEHEMKKIRDRITYEDIGGLDNVIQKVREMIELPIRHPELFKRIGIDPPKGV